MFLITIAMFFVSVMAAAQGNVEMATGNAIGSVTANTGMILGLSIIFMPVAVNRNKYLPKSLILMGAIVLLWALSLNGELTLFASIIMFLCFAFFIYENIIEAKRDMTPNEEKGEGNTDKKTVTINILKFIVGAAFIVIGSRLLVNEGTVIATDILHIDERIVSLTLVAVGTSLPELVTTLTAIAKKQSSLSVGNIVGANIIDMLLILPICSFISGGSLPVAFTTIWIDLPVALLVTLITLLPMLITKKFHRWQGILSLAVYIGYVILICVI